MIASQRGMVVGSKTVTQRVVVQILVENLEIVFFFSVLKLVRKLAFGCIQNSASPEACQE